MCAPVTDNLHRAWMIRLPEHIATIVEYLNQATAHATNPEASIGPSQKFTKYLVATSWWKLEHWTQNWKTIGFLYNLVNIPEDAVSQLLASFWSYSGKSSIPEKNNRLVQAIIQCKPSILKLIYKTTHPSLVSNLSLVFRSPFEMLKKACQASPLMIYTDESALDFHFFLIGMMVGYIKFLHQLKKTKKYDPTITNLVFVFGSLLAEIAQSSTFMRHINTISSFLIPLHSQISDYSAYSQKIPSSDNTQNTNAWLEDPDVVPPVTTDPKQELVQIVSILIKTFYLKHVLDNMCWRIGQTRKKNKVPLPPNIWGMHLLGITKVQNMNLSWDELQEELKHIYEGQASQEDWTATAVVQKLEEELNLHGTNSGQSIVDRVNRVRCDLESYFGRMHAEAILLAFLFTSHNDLELEFLWEVLYTYS